MSKGNNEQIIEYYENGVLQCLLCEQDAKQVMADHKSWGNKVSLVEDRNKKKKRVYVVIKSKLKTEKGGTGGLTLAEAIQANWNMNAMLSAAAGAAAIAESGGDGGGGDGGGSDAGGGDGGGGGAF